MSPVIGNSVLHSVMFTLKNKNKEICKEKFELMYVQVKDVSKVSKLEKKFSRSLSPEISMLRRSLKVNLFFKSRILRAGSLFFSKIWGLVLYTTVLYRTILRVLFWKFPLSNIVPWDPKISKSFHWIKVVGVNGIIPPY